MSLLKLCGTPGEGARKRGRDSERDKERVRVRVTECVRVEALQYTIYATTTPTIAQAWSHLQLGISDSN